MGPEQRTPIGLWSELGPGARWTNEGVSRVVGFLVEGAAAGRKYVFHIVVPHGMAETVRADLSGTSAVEGLDWQVWEPARATTDPAELARFANRTVPVRAWVVTFPHFSGALSLEKPKAVLYPDALPYDFPLGWNEDSAWGEEGHWPRWRATATKVAETSDKILTFSEHVAVRHAGPLCAIPREKIEVVPLAPPDLAPLLPFVVGRRQTTDSRERAAEILREYARAQNLHYARDFPFEQIDFVSAATQDRPTKNLGVTAEAVRRIVRDMRRNMKLLMTAGLYRGATWTRLPQVIEGDYFHHDLLLMPDLPREVHAALFHCATVVVHSSFFEGIVGALPFYEAASLGTPCLLARGPHTDELQRDVPELGQFLYDPYDVDGLATLILEVVQNRAEYVDAQSAIHDRLAKQTWADVASAYAEAALSGEPLASGGPA